VSDVIDDVYGVCDVRDDVIVFRLERFISAFCHYSWPMCILASTSLSKAFEVTLRDVAARCNPEGLSSTAAMSCHAM